MTNNANPKLSFLCCNQKGFPEKIKQTAYFSLIRSFIEYGPLSGTHTKQSTTALIMRVRSVALQGSLKVGIQDTLVFLI